MVIEEKYMKRCLQLAANGRGQVNPNPMVGAVIVHENKIIGEGYHQEYGKAHAEVNAIDSVKDKSLLSQSTIYVSLEPCSHYGKTPPCSQLIIDSKIPRVVVATLDPYPKVSGRGVNMLKEAGVEVEVGLLKDEAQELNKEFFKYYTANKPYVYLKWAQTRDGFIDKKRTEGEPVCPTIISNDLTQILVHKLRANVSAIMVATNTAVNDNPSLTTRLWYGKNPIRLILDRTGRIPNDYKIFDGLVPTYIFMEQVDAENQENNVVYVPLAFDQNTIANILDYAQSLSITSILVEGGSQFLQTFIDTEMWDEAFIEISDHEFFAGTKAPEIRGKVLNSSSIMMSQCLHLKKD